MASPRLSFSEAEMMEFDVELENAAYSKRIAARAMRLIELSPVLASASKQTISARAEDRHVATADRIVAAGLAARSPTEPELPPLGSLARRIVECCDRARGK